MLLITFTITLFYSYAEKDNNCSCSNFSHVQFSFVFFLPLPTKLETIKVILRRLMYFKRLFTAGIFFIACCFIKRPPQPDKKQESYIWYSILFLSHKRQQSEDGGEISSLQWQIVRKTRSNLSFFSQLRTDRADVLDMQVLTELLFKICDARR